MHQKPAVTSRAGQLVLIIAVRLVLRGDATMVPRPALQDAAFVGGNQDLLDCVRSPSGGDGAGLPGVGVSDGEALMRIVPKQFRTPEHVVRGNLVFKKVEGALRLVGQLEELGSTQGENLAGLCGGDKRLQLLNAAGSVASILNLGVCVLGFLHVSKLLHRIEDRIEGIETKLDEVAELAGVIDQKVDQLVDLSEGQTEALAAIHELIVSFETARVHAALETLDFRSRTSQSERRDEHLIEAAETLQVFRNWLAEKRASSPEATAGRVELLRAEVAIVLAECRARCLADDVEFAAHALERVMHSAQAEVAQMYEWLMDHGGVRHLVMSANQNMGAGTALFDTEDAVEAVAWVEGIGSTGAGLLLLSRLRDSHEQLELEVQRLESEVRATAERLEGFRDVNKLMELIMSLSLEAGTTRKPAVEEALAEPFHAASFVASYRLMRDVESARAMCKALEVFGEPVRELLFEEDALPGSPALALAWEPERPDGT